MKEKQIQAIFGKKNKIKGVFELKLCKGKSIRWDSVKSHQVQALSMAKHGCLYHKIADMTFGREGFGNALKKPFDCFNIQSAAFVVVCFYIPRKQKAIYYIDIDDYLSFWKKSSKKSYNEEEAKQMAKYQDSY